MPSLMGRGMEELHLEPFSSSVTDHTERAVSTLHIGPKVTVETL